jgi:hypothetical protein
MKFENVLTGAVLVFATALMLGITMCATPNAEKRPTMVTHNLSLDMSVDDMRKRMMKLKIKDATFVFPQGERNDFTCRCDLNQKLEESKVVGEK